MTENRRPNIIIFNPDEMRWNTMGHMGNPAAHTPNLDSFARTEAVSFENAYCQNPVCVPSRCSFFTGLYPHTSGHRTMNYLQHAFETNLFQELKDAGYYVWMNCRNDLVAGQIPGLVESQADEVYYYDRSRPVEPVDPALLRSMGGPVSDHPYSHFKGVSRQEMGSDSDDVRAAIDRILHPQSEKPLCMFIGLNNPPPPYVVEQRYYDLIDPDKIPARAQFKDTKGKSNIIRKINELSGLGDYTQEQWKEMQRVYLAQCAFIDELFGKVIEALKEAGEYDNSAIFFLSDHGDFAGDYDLPEKAQNTFENCLTKVPLLVKPPKQEAADPGIAAGLVELVDFYATAMDYAGVPSTHDHFGRSLRPVIEDRKKQVRQYAFCEGGRRPSEVHCDEYHVSGPNGPAEGSEYWARMNAQIDPLAHEKGTMVTDGVFKYVERLSGYHEFYDLEADPQEMTNLYEERKNSAEVQRLKEALLHWYQETCDIVPLEYDSRFTEERLWAMVRRFCPAECEEEFREFARNHYDPGECARYGIGLLMRKMKAQNG